MGDYDPVKEFNATGLIFAGIMSGGFFSTGIGILTYQYTGLQDLGGGVALMLTPPFCVISVLVLRALFRQT